MTAEELEAIRGRLAASDDYSAPWHTQEQNEAIRISHAYDDVAALVAEVERLGLIVAAAMAFSQACADDGAWIADKASDEGWLATERAIKVLWDIAPAGR